MRRFERRQTASHQDIQGTRTRILGHCELELQHQVVTDSRNAHFLRRYTVQKRQVLD